MTPPIASKSPDQIDVLAITKRRIEPTFGSDDLGTQQQRGTRNEGNDPPRADRRGNGTEIERREVLLVGGEETTPRLRRHARRHSDHFGVDEVAEERGDVFDREINIGINEEHVRSGDPIETGHPGCSRAPSTVVTHDGDVGRLEPKRHRRAVVDDDDRHAGKALDQTTDTRLVVEHRDHDRDIDIDDRINLRVHETTGKQSTRKSSFGFAITDRRTADPAIDRHRTLVTEPHRTHRCPTE